MKETTTGICEALSTLVQEAGRQIGDIERLDEKTFDILIDVLDMHKRMLQIARTIEYGVPK